MKQFIQNFFNNQNPQVDLITLRDNQTKLLRKAGLKYKHVTGNVPYLYDGTRLLINKQAKNEAKNVYCHELAHYQLASEDRKHLPNYGLGGSYIHEKAFPDRVISIKAAQKEEECASALGLYLFFLCGAHDILCMKVASEEGWRFSGSMYDTECERRKFVSIITKLQKQGYLDNNGNPIFKQGK